MTEKAAIGNPSEDNSNFTFREKVGKWVESRPVQNFIIGLIMFNALTIGLETSDDIMAEAGSLLHTIDTIILGIFVLEIAIKLFAFRFKFFSNSWNDFDFIIVVIALLPTSGPFSILRTLRVFRTLRLLKTIPRLRFIVEALLKAIPSIAWIFGLLLIVFYVFAVMSTKMFGTAFPQWFGSVGDSMYSLFQIMTLESWSMGIARPVMEEFPHAYLLFIPFILIATYTTLNIFIAIVVNTMSEIHEDDIRREKEALGEIIEEEHEETDSEIADLKLQLNRIEQQIAELSNKIDSK